MSKLPSGYKPGQTFHQSTTVANALKAIQSKKLPAKFNNSGLCSPVKYFANQKIGDCELASTLHLFQIQYKMIKKTFDVPDSSGSFWFIDWGTSSDQEVYQLVQKILHYLYPMDYPANANLDNFGGFAVDEIVTYGKKFGFFGARISKAHNLSELELANIELIKRIIYYFGGLHVAVTMMEYEYNNSTPPYTFNMPPGCPYTGIDLYNKFSSWVKNMFYYSDWGNGNVAYPGSNCTQVNNIKDFWNYAVGYANSAGTDSRNLPQYTVPEVLNLSKLIQQRRGRQQVPRSRVFWGTANYFNYYLSDAYPSPGDSLYPYFQYTPIPQEMVKFSSWGEKSGKYLAGHAIILTGWDDTGFNFVTWEGAGHMSYDYWYIHHLEATVIIPEVWEGHLQGKNAELLLATL